MSQIRTIVRDDETSELISSGILEFFDPDQSRITIGDEDYRICGPVQIRSNSRGQRVRLMRALLI